MIQLTEETSNSKMVKVEKNKFNIDDAVYYIYSSYSRNMKLVPQLSRYRVRSLSYLNGWSYKITENMTVSEGALYEDYKEALKELKKRINK